MLRLSSPLHWLSALVVSSALLACGDDEQTFTPPSGDAGAAGTTGGSSGTSGQGGTTAGSSGSAGNAGQGGSAGASGQGGAGASGASGQSGAAGTAGAAGSTGGAAGDAGAGGTAAGAAGSTGGTDAGGAGQGGAAGSTGGGAGTGGSGGAPAQLTCLPASDHASVLKLESSSPFCAVRVHKTSLASLGFSTQITWGGHGGPLSTDTTSGAVVRRWAPGTDVHAALDATATTVTVPNLPAKVFFGPAVDVPGTSLTTLSYTTTDATASGEIVALDTALTTVKSRAAVNGFYSGVALPSSLDLAKPRLLFTALSPVTAAATTTSEGGFYALDLCDSTTLLKDGCGASFKKGTWAGGASGPVAVDALGFTFAALSTFGGNQEVHAFEPDEATSAAATTGKVVLTNTDFSTSIAASAPTGNTSGLVVVQTSDATTFAAKPALVYSYAVTEGTLSTTAVANGGFEAAKAGASPFVFGAPDGTIWVAVDGPDAAYFVALQRK